MFEIPNPYDYCKEDEHYNNITWNLEQAVLALKEGYADGFFTSNGLFGSSTNAFKVVDPIQAVKVRNYFLEDFKGWIEQIEKKSFHICCHNYNCNVNSRNWKIKGCRR